MPDWKQFRKAKLAALGKKKQKNKNFSKTKLGSEVRGTRKGGFCYIIIFMTFFTLNILSYSRCSIIDTFLMHRIMRHYFVNEWEFLVNISWVSLGIFNNTRNKKTA